MILDKSKIKLNSYLLNVHHNQRTFVQLGLGLSQAEQTPTPTTTTQTFRQQYLSWPVFDQNLNKGSWEHIQQITNVTTTFVKATFVLGTFVHISNISAVTGPIWIKL